MGVKTGSYSIGVLFFVLIFSISSCGTESNENEIIIVSTTGQIGDLVNSILEGLEFKNFILMGPGVDPHGYIAAARDIEKIQSADLIIYNGLDLEAKMADLLAVLGSKSFSLGESLPENRLLGWEGHPDLKDPHVWNDIDLWEIGIENTKNRILELFSNTDALVIEENYQRYIAKIKDLKAWALDEMSEIPVDQRYLISSHDAFNYFSKYFGLEAMALQGISTEDEVSIQDIRNLAELIVEYKIPAIFTESSVSPKSIEALKDAVEARNWTIRVPETELFSDALGEVAPENTYIGMIRHNVSTIVKYLGEVPTRQGE